jgi:alkyl sulfatase BDS1-like metallo-beta-lactamase superfamily hydrolase
MVLTYKNKFNLRYNFPRDEPHSLKEIAKTTGYKLSGLQTIYDKGIGAFKTNPASVRPEVKSPEQWAYARVYSAVMGGKASGIDERHLVK